MSYIFKYLKGDKVIWSVVLLLSILSLLAVYSSTGTLAYRYQSGNTEYYVLKHFIILVFGLAIMYGAHRIKYNYYSRLSQVAIYLAVPLLILTLAMGTNLNSASRWLTLPVINMSFQTSDFAKLALIMYMARLLSKKQDRIKDFKSAFLPLILPVVIVCGLILPANFSTAAVLFTTCMILMFIGRVNVLHLMGLVGTAIIGAVMMILLSYVAPVNKILPRVDTWKSRIETYFTAEEANEGNKIISDSNYQVEQAKIAIATGGITGKGPGNSTQRNFLPHPYSDFIYAIIVEEYGLLGGIAVLLLYLILLFRGIRIVIKSPKTFGTLLAMGCCFGLIFQAMINMAVAVNLLPVTGQPLPLLSMGGTSIWFTSIAIGIILSVSKMVEEETGETNTVQNAVA